MEGEVEDSDEDVEPQDRSSSPHSAVLWERCIQHSIFVDLSEDESLHFSDLEGSFAVCLSQAESAPSEASMHLSENAELSDSDDSSSECSCVSSQSERMVEGKTKSNMTCVSAQRPNTSQKEPPLTQGHEDPGQNTSDEEQEDLPYDGYLGSPYFNHTANSEENSNMGSDGRETLHESPNAPGLSEIPAVYNDKYITQGGSSVEFNAMEPAFGSPEEDENKRDRFINTSMPAEGPLLCSSPVSEAQQPDMTQLLLRHFSQDELLCLGRLIEAETLPEVSFLESMDETLLSRALRHSSTEGPRNDNGAAPTYSNAASPSGGDSETSHSFHGGNGGRIGDKSHSASENLEPASLEQEAERSFNNVTTSATDGNISNSMCIDSKQDSRGSSGPDLSKNEEDGQVQIIPLVRTRSFTELKYGQGQVHYPLPDFSKVAPKVKIPKTPSGPARPVPPSPSTIYRAQSSPGILEVIHRVLEDTVQPSEKPYVFRDQDKQPDTTAPALVHHLQAEYDKLLTKYAEAENLIDQMRLGTKIQAPSDPLLEFDCGDQQDHPSHGGDFGSLALSTPPPPTGKFVAEPAYQSNCKQLNASSSRQLDQQGPSDGERMTTELKNIISQFMQKVEEFKLCVNTTSVSIAEQQMMLKSMMEAQDQLERNYIIKKEEHRALEMQNYLGLARNTGTFDPDRLVEGDIFRVGMHLEDIKELIDMNVCEQLSPPHSSSTPMPQTPSVEPRSPRRPTPSPPSPLHEEEPSACFSTVGYEMGRTEEEKEEEEASELHGGDVSEQNSEHTTLDSLLSNTGHHSSHSRSLQGSLEGLDITTTEEEEGEEEERSSVLSESIVHDNILAYLTETNSAWTPVSISSQHSALSPESECDLGGSVSLTVEVSCSSEALRPQSLSEPSLCSSSTSQRIVSPETDSGFGSSYLSQPATALTQPKLLTDSVQIHYDGLSCSDSEGSCSNLQTAIHPATLSDQRRGSGQTAIHPATFSDQHRGSGQTAIHPATLTGQHMGSLETPAQTQSCGAGTAVDLWVENATQKLPARLQDSDPHLPSRLYQHMPGNQSDPILSITMDTPQRDSYPQACSCNSEAFLALQSEVSRLKKDLEEGLVQLPHLAQRMDYLTSKYRQDRRPKTRPRSHHKPTSNSILKPPVRSERQRGSNSSLVKIEDWISSDMDPSKSKGTDSGDSMIMLQFHSMPAGSRRGSTGLYSCSEPAGEPQSKKHSNRGSEENCSVKTSDLAYSSLKMENQGQPYSNATYRTLSGEMESVYSKGRFSSLSPLSLQKPLLQVNYGSSCSLPASYKVRESPLQLVAPRRSTQSDTALLPSNVYFQRTQARALAPSKTGTRTSRCRGSKEEEMNRTLDRAIEAARTMKRTTDRMAKSLSADLAKAEFHRRLHNMHPLGSRNHTSTL